MRLSIMQPYFIPYAGYFRLMATSDCLVLYDCVQFIRRGWIHRNQLLDAQRTTHWLTLPLSYAPQDARIDEMQLDDSRRQYWWEEACQKFPALQHPVNNFVRPEAGNLIDHLERQLLHLRDYFGFECRLLRSSTLNISSDLKGEERILAICKKLGAGTYINAPGGRALYNASHFKRCKANA